MAQNWNEVLTEYEEQEQVADTLPRVRVVTGTPAVTVLDARLADILGAADWSTTSDDQLVELTELYMVETSPEYTETGFLGRVKVYRPPQDGGNIVIGPVDEFGSEDELPVRVPKPMTLSEALDTLKDISLSLEDIAQQAAGELREEREQDNDSASGGR